MRRAAEARRNAGVLAACLLALRSGDESIDADVGAFVIAETILAWRQVNGVK